MIDVIQRDIGCTVIRIKTCDTFDQQTNPVRNGGGGGICDLTTGARDQITSVRVDRCIDGTIRICIRLGCLICQNRTKRQRIDIINRDVFARRVDRTAEVMDIGIVERDVEKLARRACRYRDIACHCNTGSRTRIRHRATGDHDKVRVVDQRVLEVERTARLQRHCARTIVGDLASIRLDVQYVGRHNARPAQQVDVSAVVCVRVACQRDVTGRRRRDICVDIHILGRGQSDVTASYVECRVDDHIATQSGRTQR